MNERIARAERAQHALDEFFAPVIDSMRNEYLARLMDVSTKELNRTVRTDKQTALSTALKLLDNLSGAMAAVIKDGEIARGELDRQERRLDLTPARRRLLDMGPR